MRLGLGLQVTGQKKAKGWLLSGTIIQRAPFVAPGVAPPVINGYIIGPAGWYKITNATTSQSWTRFLYPPTGVWDFGAVDDNLSVYYISTSSPSTVVALPQNTLITWSVNPAISISEGTVTVNFGTPSVVPDSYFLEHSEDAGATWTTFTGSTYNIAVGKSSKARITPIKTGFTGTPFVTNNVTHPGVLITQTWASYIAGNTFSNLSGQYARQSTAIDIAIESDTSGPALLRASVKGVSPSAGYYMWPLATVKADGTWGRMQYRARVKIMSSANLRGAIGFGGATTFSGLVISRGGSANDGRIQLLNNGDMTVHPAAGIVTGGVAGAIYDILMEVASDKRTLKAKAWAYASAEPTSWQATTALAADVSLAAGLRYFVRVPTANDPGLRILVDTFATDTDAIAF